MNNMVSFLSDMAVDPDLQEMFWENPTGAITAVGLPETVSLGFKSHQNSTVTASIVNELATHELVTVFGGACAADPGPDPWPDPPPPPSNW